MRLKRTLVTLAIAVLSMGLLPMGSASARVSSVTVTVDTVGTKTWVKPGTNDVQMMNINIASNSTSDTLVKLTVTYTGTNAADVSGVSLYDGGALIQGQPLTGPTAQFNVGVSLGANTKKVLTLKANIKPTVADGQVVKFRLDPGSVVLQTSGPAVAYTSPDHGVIIDGTPPASPSISSFPPVNIASGGVASISGTAEANAAVSLTITDTPGPHTVTFVASADGMGAWSGTPNLSAFNDGTLTVTATATDAAGNVSGVSTNTAWKDTVEPSRVWFSSVPPYVNFANQGNISMGGNAEGNATVSMTVRSTGGGTPLSFGPTTAGAGNTFAFSNMDLTSLPDGKLIFSAMVTDGAGNNSMRAGVIVKKDTIANPPAVTTHHANAGNSTVWPLSGTAEPGATVSYSVVSSFNATAVSGQVVADGTTGVYSVNLNLNTLGDGNLTTTVSQVDLANNTSATATGAPAIKDILVPAAPTIAAFANANFSNRLAAAISGTAEVGATVNIAVTGTSGSATATATAGGGNWSTTVNVSSLPDGPMSATATATDAVGNVSVASAAYTTATKDATVPGAPTVVFATVNSSTQAAAPISGKAEAGSTVSVTVSDGTTTTSAVTATVNVSGDWSAMVDVSALTDGPITASVKATDAAANVSAVATKTAVKDTVVIAPVFSISVPRWVNVANQTAVTFSGRALNVEAGATVKVRVVDPGMAETTYPVTALPDGSWSMKQDLSGFADGILFVELWQVDAAGNVGPAINPQMEKDTAPPAAPVINPVLPYVFSGNVTAVPFSGQAEANAKVTLTVTDSFGRKWLTDITADDWGRWFTTMDLSLSRLAEGPLTVKATAQDWAGNTGVAATAAGTPIKDTIAPAAPTTNTIPTVNAASAGAVTVSGTAEWGATVAVTVTSSGGVTSVSDSMTAAGGSYSFSLNLSGLTDGLLTATVTAIDAAGNASTATTTTATKDTVANDPAIVLGSWPTVNIANQGAYAISGAAGNAEPGATVTVELKDQSLTPTTCTATALADGSWSCTANLTGLVDGPLTVRIKQLDVAGNTSPWAAVAGNITKDTVLPTIGTAGVAYGLNTNYQYYAWNRQADITATASKSATWTYTVKDPFGTIVVTNTTAASSSFALTWAPAQYAASGNYTVTLSATDLALNPIAAPTTITIPVYNYAFRITGTQILNSAKTAEAVSVVAGTDYYVVVMIQNLNTATVDSTSQVVFQQSQGTVQAFTSRAVIVLHSGTTYPAFLWHPTVGSKSVDFFVWNHLAPAGREALSTPFHTTVTVN